MGAWKNTRKFVDTFLHSNEPINDALVQPIMNRINNHVGLRASLNGLKREAKDGVMSDYYIGNKGRYLNKDGNLVTFKDAGTTEVPLSDKVSKIQMAESLFLHDDGSLAKGRIAGVAWGGFATASAGVGVVANGSPFRDRQGNFDLPGVPIF